MKDCIVTQEFGSVNNRTLEYLDKVVFSISVASEDVDKSLIQIYPWVDRGGYTMKVLNCPSNANVYISNSHIGEGESFTVNTTTGNGYWKFSASGTYELEISHLIGVGSIVAAFENGNPMLFKRCYFCEEFKVGTVKYGSNIAVSNFSIEPFVETLNEYRYIEENGTININVYGIIVNGIQLSERPGVKLQFSSDIINIVDYQNTSTKYAQFNRVTREWTYY